MLVGAVTDAAVIGNVWALVVALVVARAASWWMYRRTRTGRDRSPLGKVAVWVQRAVARGRPGHADRAFPTGSWPTPTE